MRTTFDTSAFGPTVSSRKTASAACPAVGRRRTITSLLMLRLFSINVGVDMIFVGVITENDIAWPEKEMAQNRFNNIVSGSERTCQKAVAVKMQRINVPVRIHVLHVI